MAQAETKTLRNPKDTHCKWCSAPKCKNSRNRRPDLSFFRFPQDEKVCKQWIASIGREDLSTKSVSSLFNTHSLCEAHFEPYCFRKTKRKLLKRDAVPTVFDCSISSRLQSSFVPLCQFSTCHVLVPVLSSFVSSSSQPSDSSASSFDTTPSIASNTVPSTASTLPVTTITTDNDSGRVISTTITDIKAWRDSKNACFRGCSALWCKNTQDRRPDLSFFRFPRDEKVCKQWIASVRREDLAMKPVSKLHKTNSLCEVHFEPRCFQNSMRKHLKRDAVPTLFALPLSSTHLSLKAELNSSVSLSSQPSNSSPPGTTITDITALRNPKNTHCTWCSAPQCKNSRNRRPDLSFFRFPRDEKVCKQWVARLKRKDLAMKSGLDLFNHNSVCEAHFEPCCFRKTRRKLLKKDAVPTVFEYSKSSRRQRRSFASLPQSSKCHLHGLVLNSSVSSSSPQPPGSSALSFDTTPLASSPPPVSMTTDDSDTESATSSTTITDDVQPALLVDVLPKSKSSQELFSFRHSKPHSSHSRLTTSCQPDSLLPTITTFKSSPPHYSADADTTMATQIAVVSVIPDTTSISSIALSVPTLTRMLSSQYQTPNLSHVHWHSQTSSLLTQTTSNSTQPALEISPQLHKTSTQPGDNFLQLGEHSPQADEHSLQAGEGCGQPAECSQSNSLKINTAPLIIKMPWKKVPSKNVAKKS